MTPLSFVQVAKTYLIAFRRCEEQRPLPGGKIEMPLMPGVVCAIFSVELSIKGLLLQRGRSTKIHDISKLFGYLTAEEQKAIISLSNTPPHVFQIKLEEIRHGYVRWRYFFEHDGLNIDLGFLRSFSSAANSVAHQAVAT